MLRNLMLWIERDNIDAILYMAFNMGGIAGWADRIHPNGELKSNYVCQQVGRHGSVCIHDKIADEWLDFDMQCFRKGVKLCKEQGFVVLSLGRIIPAKMGNIGDCIVQLGLFGEMKYESREEVAV